MNKIVTLLTSAVAAASVGVAASPAQAADTPVSFTLDQGALAIDVPSSSVVLTPDPLSVGPTVMTGSLGTTTVTDSRLGAARPVTVTMTASSFINGATTIPATAAAGYSGVALPIGVTVPVGTSTDQAIGEATGASILTMTTASGSGGATYSPTVRITIPAEVTTAGTYNGTISQTVL